MIENGLARLVERGIPRPPEGWALIRVIVAGICGTDLAILGGYADAGGVPGHEFVGRVVSGAEGRWQGRRVVGDINVGCGACDACRQGDSRHCPGRRVLGIRSLDGCLAEYCLLPAANLHEVPAGLSDRRAVFAEPLAAAGRILDQVPLTGKERAVVVGDGRLGILCAWALHTRLGDVTLVGHHSGKLAAASWRRLQTRLADDGPIEDADLVVEATGTAGGLAAALGICRAQGTLVVKSTLTAVAGLDLSPVVVKEIRIVGSRCGRPDAALEMMTAWPDLPLERLVTAAYPLERAPAALAHAGRAGAIKVLVEGGGSA